MIERNAARVIVLDENHRTLLPALVGIRPAAAALPHANA
jgi:hypothetical protein